MDALGLSRFNTAVIVPAVGLVAGHLLMPVRAGVPLWPQVALFALLMAATGALRGWREATLRAPRPRRVGPVVVLFALASVLLAALGYVALHGVPRM